MINLKLQFLDIRDELESAYKYLKKRSVRKNKIIILKKKDRFEMLSSEDFKKHFDVEYIDDIYFENVTLLKKVILKCKKGVELGAIAEKEIWLGTYFEEELNKAKNPSVYIKWIDYHKEYGLFALKDLKEDSFIGEYTGELRRHKRALDRKNGYCFEYQIGDSKRSSFTIDAKYMGNYLRFINHSENPNLNLYAAYLNGILHIILKSNRLIRKDEELTYDYGPSYWKKRENPK